MMRTYIAMLRVVFDARSDLHANGTAHWFREHIESTLEPNDNVDVTQVFCYGDGSKPDEVINRLKTARNELIRLRYRDTMDIAQLVDQVICKLEHQVGEDELAPNYDYTRIYEFSKIIEKGEEPLL